MRAGSATVQAEQLSDDVPNAGLAPSEVHWRTTSNKANGRACRPRSSEFRLKPHLDNMSSRFEP